MPSHHIFDLHVKLLTHSAMLDSRNGSPFRAEGFWDEELSALSGEKIDEGSIRPVARQALILAISPACGPCKRLLPELAHWHEILDATTLLIVLAQGGSYRNREIAREFKIKNFYLDQGGQFAGRLGLWDLPSGRLVDESGSARGVPFRGRVELGAAIRACLRARPSELEVDVGEFTSTDGLNWTAATRLVPSLEK